MHARGRRSHRQLPPPDVHAKDNWIFLIIPTRHFQIPHPPLNTRGCALTVHEHHYDVNWSSQSLNSDRFRSLSVLDSVI